MKVVSANQHYLASSIFESAVCTDPSPQMLQCNVVYQLPTFDQVYGWLKLPDHRGFPLWTCGLPHLPDHCG